MKSYEGFSFVSAVPWLLHFAVKAFGEIRLPNKATSTADYTHCSIFHSDLLPFHVIWWRINAITTGHCVIMHYFKRLTKTGPILWTSTLWEDQVSNESKKRPYNKQVVRLTLASDHQGLLHERGGKKMPQFSFCQRFYFWPHELNACCLPLWLSSVYW